MPIITVRPAQTIEVDIDSIYLESVTDSSTAQTIIGRAPALQRDFYLWYGPEEYAEAGIWTNETALARAKELVNADDVRFV